MGLNEYTSMNNVSSRVLGTNLQRNCGRQQGPYKRRRTYDENDNGKTIEMFKWQLKKPPLFQILSKP